MMRSVRCVLGVLVLLVAVATPAPAAGGTVDDEVLDTFAMFPHDVIPLRTGGGTVAWLAQTSTDVDIHGWAPAQLKAVRLPDRQPVVIADFPVYEGGLGFVKLDVDGDVVVWTELRDQHVIRGMRLSTGEAFVVAELPIEPEGERVANLTLSGSWVAWSSADASTMWIRARNIAQMGAVVTLAERHDDADAWNVAVNSGLLLDSDWLVWADDEQVVVQHLGTEEPAFHLDAPLGVTAQGRYAYPLHTDWAHDDTAVATARVIDLATRAERDVSTSFTAAVEGPYPIGSAIAFDGRYVFQAFQLNLSTGNVTATEQVLAYDLQTDSVFPVFQAKYVTLDADDGVLAWFSGRGNATIAALSLAERVPSAPVPDSRPVDARWTYVPATQHYLQFGFAAYWGAQGGLPIFGYPLTEEFSERNADSGAWQTVQYLERQRFEFHPEHQGTPYEVLLGRLGAESLLRQGRDWHGFPAGDPRAPHYVAETGHAIDERFWGYWSSHGLEFGDPGTSDREALALFGYPLSEPLFETNADGDTVLTQYFERAVFEWRPAHAGTASEVLLRRLGAKALVARGW